MPEYNDTPQATDRISATQAPIQTNFTSLSTTLNINHVGITTATDYGKHIKVDLTTIGAAPTAAATELVAYNLLFATSAKQELYVRRNGETGVPITARGGTTAGWTYLPSGLLVKWGSITTAAASQVDLNAVAGPNFSNAQLPFAAFASPKVTANGVAAAFITGTMATPILEVRTPTAGAQAYWIVIGV